MKELPQKYRSLSHFVGANLLTLPRDQVWRLTPRLLGQVNGLPTSHGVLTATNGIDCYIEQENDQLFLGHVGWFIADSGKSVKSIVQRTESTSDTQHRKLLREQKHREETQKLAELYLV
jgi:hypothetical protein